jgi:hypothetical protein
VPRRARLLVVLIATAIVVERVVSWARTAPTDFDDAYMFVRYADAWLHGRGISWNGADGPVYGATSLAHLCVVTILRAIGCGDARAIMTASTGAAVVALAILLARSRGAWIALLVPVIAWSDAFGFHATTGMDTMCSLAANAALGVCVLWLIETPSVRAAIVCAVMGWLAIEARPDNAVVALLAPLLALVMARARARVYVAWVAPLVLLVGTSLIVKRAYFGTALPLSFYAKRPMYYGGFVGEYTWNPWWFLAVFFRASAAAWMVIILGARRRHLPKLLVLLLPAAITVAALFHMNQIMGHLGRFYFPMLAWVVLAAFVCAEAPDWRRAPLILVLWLGGGWALHAIGAHYESHEQKVADLGGYTTPCELDDRDSWQSSIEMAQLAAAAPPGTRFAMTEHGLVAARAPQAVIIDPLGLHDRDFALHGFSSTKLFARQPELIWMSHPDYTQMIRDILDEDAFWRDYDFYPDALSFGVAIRKGSALSLARFYPGKKLEECRATRTSAKRE